MVKNLSAVQETQVQSPGREYRLEKGLATHSSILAWRIPWTEETGGLYSPWGLEQSHTTEQLTAQLLLDGIKSWAFVILEAREFPAALVSLS